jgi:methylmalonyl-CoA/ethylmalonyl-CoA epimerase
MIKKVDHIGVAVKDVNKAGTLFQDLLGAQLIRKKMYEDQKLISALLFIGESRMELMQSVAEDSVISKFIKAKGEGVHHISLEVDNLEEMVKRLQMQGIRVMGFSLNSRPKLGFIHPESACGVLIELIER